LSEIGDAEKYGEPCPVHNVDKKNNALVTVTFDRHDPDMFRSGIRALVEGGRNYS
jgi:hypothetical protein